MKPKRYTKVGAVMVALGLFFGLAYPDLYLPSAYARGNGKTQKRVERGFDPPRNYIHIENVKIPPFHNYIRAEHRSGYDKVDAVDYFESEEKFDSEESSRIAEPNSDDFTFTIRTKPYTACARCHRPEVVRDKFSLKGTPI